MILAEVIGNVVTSEITDWIEDPVFLMTEEVDCNGKRSGNTLIALDLIGANQGEMVLVSQGSSVRQTDQTKERPVDAIIAGIVDMVDHEGILTYDKSKA